MNKKRVLFAASEIYPFAKSGGLADVAYSLPKALQHSYQIDLIMPLYGLIDQERFGIKLLSRFEIKMGVLVYPVALYHCHFENLSCYFVQSPVLSDREHLYGTLEGAYPDNDIRFGLFNYAILEILKREPYDLVHVNDWQCGLLPLLLHQDKKMKTKSIFTIHNLAYQGLFEWQSLERLGIKKKYFTMDGIEFYGQVSLMKAGIAYADHITTVSPTYAKEILTEKYGCGLEGFLTYHQAKLSGILNGLDTEHFSPEQDRLLSIPYSDQNGKALNKAAYYHAIGEEENSKPLLVFIGRLAWQKGLEVFIESLPTIAQMECHIAILGEGDQKYHEALLKVARFFKNVTLTFGYEEAFSHQLYAASDFFLMPSVYEPCGLTQMIAMRYGSLPIVHHVGGLADSVLDYDAYDTHSKDGYGIVFDRMRPKEFTSAVGEALRLYKDKEEYGKLIRHNMQCDFSWNQRAKSYRDVYDQLMTKG